MFKDVSKFRFIPQAICVVILALAITPFIPPHKQACAQNLESAVCDPEIWDTIVQRSWIEAQREIEINQSIITRPDSVLELSCFDSFAMHNAKIVGSIFSDSSGGGALLETQVSSSAISAVTSDLGAAGYSANPLAGGVYKDAGGSYVNYTPSATVDFNGQCANQKQIWDSFKCRNAVDMRGVVFDAMKDNDPRLVFAGNSANTCADVATTGGLVDAAPVWTNALQRLNTPGLLASGAVNATYFDLVTTFSDMTAPTGACSAPITTGVQIVLSDGSTVAERVCPNPGCSYDGTNCVR